MSNARCARTLPRRLRNPPGRSARYRRAKACVGCPPGTCVTACRSPPRAYGTWPVSAANFFSPMDQRARTSDMLRVVSSGSWSRLLHWAWQAATRQKSPADTQQDVLERTEPTHSVTWRMHRADARENVADATKDVCRKPRRTTTPTTSADQAQHAERSRRQGRLQGRGRAGRSHLPGGDREVRIALSGDGTVRLQGTGRRRAGCAKRAAEMRRDGSG